MKEKEEQVQKGRIRLTVRVKDINLCDISGLALYIYIDDEFYGDIDIERDLSVYDPQPNVFNHEIDVVNDCKIKLIAKATNFTSKDLYLGVVNI